MVFETLIYTRLRCETTPGQAAFARLCVPTSLSPDASAARPFSRNELLQKAIALPANAFGLPFEAEQNNARHIQPKPAETDYVIKRGQAQPRVEIEQLVLRLAAM